MNEPHQIMAKTHLIYAFLFFAFFGTILYFFNPESSIWFPKCPFYIITGYQCPACGLQRAAYQLLHLNLIEALRYNPFLVISIPYALLVVIASWLDFRYQYDKLKRVCLHPITVKTYIIMFVCWWIIRNV